MTKEIIFKKSLGSSIELRKWVALSHKKLSTVKNGVAARAGPRMLTTMPDGSKFWVPAWGSEMYCLKLQTKYEETAR